MAEQTAYIGLGSNLGDREAHIRKALTMLGERQGIRVVSISDIIETVALGGMEQPDYLNIFLYLGWGLEFEILKGFTWYNGIQIGNYQMYFDDYEIHESQRIESELGVGLSTRVGFNIKNSWMVQGILTYQYVYTKKPLEFLILKAGIGYGFDTPKWLQEFLK